MKKINTKFNQGFTLLEMAVVLIIVGLMMGVMLIPLTAQVNQANYAENKRKMLEIKEATIGYALIHGYLPCPAKAFNDGTEDRNSSGVCNKRNGFIPWSEIGVEKLDVWEHLYLYSVTSAFSQAYPKISLTPAPTSDITIKTRDTTGTLVNLSNANAIPFVVVSLGRNANLATQGDGFINPNRSAGAANIDEVTNALATKVFISRALAEQATSAGGEYDDVVVWVPLGLYLNKMVSALQLP